MMASTKAIRFLESLSIPEGPKAAQSVTLPPLQKQFVKSALAGGINVINLSNGRLNAKTALWAGIALSVVMGVKTHARLRKAPIAIRTGDEARLLLCCVVGFKRLLHENW